MNDGWFDYDYKDFVIHERAEVDGVVSLDVSLAIQALKILGKHHPLVFVSGGIDSQVMALAFARTKEPATYIYIRPWIDNHYNEVEYVYASAFAHEHEIKLDVVDLRFDDAKHLGEFLLEQNYFNSPVGSGTVFLLEGIRQAKERWDGTPVTADGHFVFTRTGAMCRGSFKKPGLSLSEGIRLEDQILFDFYSSDMFAYYEWTHRNTLQYQIPTRMEAKNIFYNELGIQLRPKMSGWEFLDSQHDYSKLSTIDFANDHSKSARHMMGIEAICDTMGVDLSMVNKKKQLQKDDSDRFITLYEFETEAFSL